jgi:hypothetical protein
LVRVSASGIGIRISLVDLRNPLLVPVVWFFVSSASSRGTSFGQLERPGARGLAGELVPVLAELFVLRGARDQEPEHLVGEERVDGLGGDLDGGVVDLGVARDRGQAGLHLRALALVELRRLVVEHLVEIPDHRIGVEVAAVVKFDALAQGKAPFLLVGVIDLPFGGEPGHQLAGPVGDVHLPGHQRIVDRVGGELIGAGAAIRLAGRQRNIRHRNAVAHHGFGLRRNGGRPSDRRLPRQQEASNFGHAHELSSIGGLGIGATLASLMPDRHGAFVDTLHALTRSCAKAKLQRRVSPLAQPLHEIA